MSLDSTRGLFKIERGDGRRCDLCVCCGSSRDAKRISAWGQRAAAFFIIKEETLKKIAPEEERVSKFEP